MFGNNPIRIVENEANTDRRLAMQSIFYTLQGEGPLSGMPAVFLRLAGCNLACHYCDTEFESGINNRLDYAEIMTQVAASCRGSMVPRLAVLTGGEPLRQPLRELVALLTHAGMRVQIETAGTLWQHDLDHFVSDGKLVVVCSPKTPKLHPGIAAVCRHWKYIIRAGELGVDGLPERGTQKATMHLAHQLARSPGRPVDTVWVSPCDDHDELLNAANQKAAVDSALRFGYRLSLQTHKIVGLE